MHRHGILRCMCCIRLHIGLYLYHRFLEMILFIFFIAVNLGNIIVSYSTLYKSSEVAYPYDKTAAVCFALRNKIL